jgi:hypothetical protein
VGLICCGDNYWNSNSNAAALAMSVTRALGSPVQTRLHLVRFVAMVRTCFRQLAQAACSQIAPHKPLHSKSCTGPVPAGPSVGDRGLQRMPNPHQLCLRPIPQLQEKGQPPGGNHTTAEEQENKPPDQHNTYTMHALLNEATSTGRQHSYLPST